MLDLFNINPYYFFGIALFRVKKKYLHAMMVKRTCKL